MDEMNEEDTMLQSNDEIKVLGISGSLRTESTNRKALHQAMRFAAEAGGTVTEIDLKELELPPYDEEIQRAGWPEGALKLRSAIEAADVLLIASPEYNYSIPGGLKNAIDWASRGKNPFDGKIAAIFGASNGPFGTIRMQPHLRQVLAALNVLVLPQPQVFIRAAREAFAEDGSLVDPKLALQLRTLVNKTLHVARSLKAQPELVF
jgi:chromate reductase